ncbi:MFS transporter [Lichenifustis flavocetrariae]|uniref:MFS transporter n=1 Tax=Lichenifustis flavocetrariae TaxID=2949735 RepID=A0AA41YSE2_9HYPH|nr:MFS transporter [Lichenifustis flavocetrariae]MCW6506450.1 MFS transporter [Lichenifustis flavocetrariae]
MTEMRPGAANGPAASASVPQAAQAALDDLERFIERGTREFTRTNVALFAAGFTTFALIYCVQPIMPVFSQEFGVSAAEASLSLSLTTQSLAFCMLIASSLSETWGRKPVMVASLFASSVLMIASSFAPSWESFLVLRALAGVAFSGLPATAMAYVGEEMHIRSIGLAMGLYIGGTGLGALGGRFIVGFMTDFLSWRVGLCTVGILALASSVVFVLYLPPSRHFRRRALSPTVLLGGFAAHLRDPIQLILFAEGFLLLGVFVSTYNYIGYRLLAPPYGFSQTVVALIFGISLVGIVSAAWIGDFAARLGRHRVFWALVTMIFAGILATLAETLWLVLAGVTLLTFAFYGAHSVASSWVGVQARHAKAQASSLYLFSYYTGSSLLGSLGGVAWEHGRWPGVVAQSSVILVIALGLAILLALRPPVRPAPVSEGLS